MKKVIIVAIAAIVISLGSYTYLNVTRKATTIDQANRPTATQQMKEGDILKKGTFVDGDAIHKGSGQVKVIKTANGNILTFENFNVVKGPDLFIYLSKNVNAEQDKRPGEFVSLGALQNTSGDQVYKLPEKVEDYGSVLVWCRAFGVAFTVANLN